MTPEAGKLTEVERRRRRRKNIQMEQTIYALIETSKL